MATVKGVWVFNESISVPSTLRQIVEWYDPYCRTPIAYNYGFAYDSGVLMALYNSGNAFTVYSPTNGWHTRYLLERTVDFGSVEQEVSDDFYEWLTANATQTEMDVKCYKVTVKLTHTKAWFYLDAYRDTGEITFVEPLCHSSDNTFTYLLYDCAVFVGKAYNRDNSKTVYKITVNGETVDYDADALTASDNPHTLSSDTTIEVTSTVYSTDGTGRYGIKIGSTGEEETPKTIITYNSNGYEIASLEQGQRAIFPEGKKATDNVSITFGANGSITYKGVTTEVEKGKTARLLFKGKKFGSDVVISIKQ